MITYISSENADRYQLLFEKANRALNLDDENKISSLGGYFSKLKQLALLPKEKNPTFYTRLPLDEDIFEINANTRNVTIPASFQNNGIGVTGDKLAEIIYFSIDRFFDDNDLADSNVDIIFQWRTNNNQGITEHYNKDLESIPGKILFGWPISSELTSSAGIIEFAVRFYSLSQEKELLFNLSTLPARVEIKNTLNYDLIDDSITIDDHGAAILHRLQNATSGIYVPTEAIPASGRIVFDIQALEYNDHNDSWEINPENAQYHIVDLNENGITKLGIEGVADGPGTISYEWRFTPYKNGSYLYRDTYNIGEGTLEYIELDPADYVVGTTPSFNELYGSPFVYLNPTQDNETFEGRISSDFEIAVINEDYAFVLKTDRTHSVKLYQKLSTLVATKPGIYTVNVISTIKDNHIPKEMDPATDGITIPGPKTPILAYPIPDIDDIENKYRFSQNETNNVQMVHALLDEEIELMSSATPSEYDESATVETVGRTPSVNLSYKWYKLNKDNNTKQEMVNGIETVETEHISTSVLSLTSDSNEVIDDYYVAEVTTIRNRPVEESDFDTYGNITTSAQYHVTSLPPISNNNINTYYISSYVNGRPRYSINPTPVAVSLGTPLQCAIKLPEKFDNIKYLWMKVTENDELDDNALEIVPELTDEYIINGLENYKLPINTEKISDVFAETNVNYSNAYNLSTLEAIDLNNISVPEEFDKTSQYYLTDKFIPVESGHYYCVVINEWNKFKKAAISGVWEVRPNLGE